MSNKKAALHGWFYLKRTSNGNLLGEFSNAACGGRVLVEGSEFVTGTCDFSPGVEGDQTAEFNTVWMESPEEPVVARLKIRRQRLTFLLEWNERRTGKPLFEGHGMLRDGVLAGEYHSVQ